ncbi:MAG: aminopeptidase P family protein [Methylobacteriaceae bacterium]|nr:aminopeptidase P family protein [Methylobacteriaceae bacterium]
MQRETFFEESEYVARQARLRQALERRGIDVYVTTSPSCIAWACGHFSVNVWDLMFLVVSTTREPLLCLWEFEQTRFDASAVHVKGLAWATGTDPVAFATDAIRDRFANAGRIALDVASPAAGYETLERLRLALGAEVVCGIADDVRLVKSAAEVAMLTASAAITDAAIEAAFATTSPGIEDRDIAAVAMAELAKRGSAMFSVAPIVAVGWRAGAPHSSWGGSRVGRGEPVFIELGASVARYTTPLMRTKCFEPSHEVEELARYSDACLAAVMARTKPGERVCDLVRAGLDTLAPIRARILFHDTMGYSLGVTYPPAWLDNLSFILSLANTREVEENMVFHLPVMLRVAGRYGAGFSESILVTARGCERFSRLRRALSFA